MTTHIDWIDCAVKRPPQNKWLLWLPCGGYYKDDGTIGWRGWGVRQGIYRFGWVDALGGAFQMRARMRDPTMRVFWAERGDMPDGID